MRKRYEEHIEIDQQQLNQTIEITKQILKRKEIKYEVNSMRIWKSFFEKESRGSLLCASIVTALMCWVTLAMQLNGYMICLMHSAVLGLLILYEYVKSSIYGMEELLAAVKYSPAKIFVYKSNVFILISILLVLVLNLFMVNSGKQFAVTLLYSLVPLYFISGIALLIVDKIQSKLTLMAVYFCSYISIGFIYENCQCYELPAYVIAWLVGGAFVCYGIGAFIHASRLNAGKGVNYGIIG